MSPSLLASATLGGVRLKELVVSVSHRPRRPRQVQSRDCRVSVVAVGSLANVNVHYGVNRSNLGLFNIENISYVIQNALGAIIVVV